MSFHGQGCGAADQDHARSARYGVARGIVRSPAKRVDAMAPGPAGDRPGQVSGVFRQLSRSHESIGLIHKSRLGSHSQSVHGAHGLAWIRGAVTQCSWPVARPYLELHIGFLHAARWRCHHTGSIQGAVCAKGNRPRFP